MNAPSMSFDGEAIARGYDDYLVPLMFDPGRRGYLTVYRLKRGRQF